MGAEITQPVIWEGVLGEMGSYNATPDLNVPEDFLQKVNASDDDPLFVTVEVESGWSKSKRNWKPEHLQTVVDKVMKSRMSGNLGHPLLDEKAYEREFPKPQVVWAAASTRKVGDKVVAKIKGYVLKSAEAREYLKLGLIDGVSIFGNSRMKPVPGGYEVIDFDPETIDFARLGRAGMTSRVVALTAEQAPRGGEVEAKDIAALQPDEIKTHAPLVYAAIQDEAKTELEAKVGEQTTAIAALQPEVDLFTEIKKLLKLSDGENPVEKLATLIENIEEAGKSEIKSFVNELIGKKFKTDRAKSIVRRLIGEMESKYEGPLTDELKTKIENDFNKVIEDDKDVTALVGEMAAFNDDDGGGNGGGASLGGRSRAGNSRGRNGNEEGVVRKTDNLTVRKRVLS